MSRRPLIYLTFFAFVACLFVLDLSRIPKSMKFLRRLTTKVLATSGDIKMPANKVVFTDYYNMYWEVDSAAENIIIGLVMDKPQQYLGVGFGQTMKSGDLWTFELSGVDTAPITATDYFSSKEDFPTDDTFAGGTNDIVLLGYEITDQSTTIKASRKLKTADSHDFVIDVSSTYVMWATTNTPYMSYHGVTGRGATNFHNVAPPKPLTPILHALTNLIVWGVLADIGLFAIKLCKGKNISIGRLQFSAQTLHMAVMILVMVPCVVVGILAILYLGVIMLDISVLFTSHAVMGLIIFGLIAITWATGSLNYFNLTNRNRNLKSNIIINKWIHKIIGCILLIMCRVNLISGAIIIEGDYPILKPITIIYVAVSTTLFILINIYQGYSGYITNQKGTVSGSSNEQKQSKLLIQAINDGTPREKILAYFPDIIWLMVGNKVYDVTNFVHPGGSHIHKACNGREVGRFFFGNYALENTNMKPYTHSAMAIAQMEQFYIGEVTNYESVLIYAQDQAKGDIQGTVSTNEIWRISSITPMTATGSQVTFISRNSDLLVKPFPQTIGALGRHFRVSYDNNTSKARIYTTAFALDAQNTKFRNGAYQFFQQLMSKNTNSSIHFEYDRSYVNSRNELSFFMKNYINENGLSAEIHNTDIESSKNKFRIEGPFGRGLELVPGSTGKHCIICAGTGILPFIDFLNLFLLKNMYELIKKSHGVKFAERVNPLNLPLENIMNGMSITLVASFANIGEVFGADIIKKLAEVNYVHKTNNFNAILRGYAEENIDTVSGRFDKEFLNKQVGYDYEKYYIVGPPQMNSDVTQYLTELGVAPEKIMLV